VCCVAQDLSSACTRAMDCPASHASLACRVPSDCPLGTNCCGTSEVDDDAGVGYLHTVCLLGDCNRGAAELYVCGSQADCDTHDAGKCVPIPPVPFTFVPPDHVTACY
jgi:hypothetical protein